MMILLIFVRRFPRDFLENVTFFPAGT
jgi:hypothetical protein